LHVFVHHAPNHNITRTTIRNNIIKSPVYQSNDLQGTNGSLRESKEPLRPLSFDAVKKIRCLDNTPANAKNNMTYGSLISKSSLVYFYSDEP
jgi:hypothetical protein